MGADAAVGRHEGASPGQGEIAAWMRAEGLSPHGWGNGLGDTYGWHEHGYEKVLYCGAGRSSGQVRRAWNRPLATGATGPPTQSRPSGPGRTSMVLGRPVNRPWWISRGSPRGRTPWCIR
jgi:hypothetical protein